MTALGIINTTTAANGNVGLSDRQRQGIAEFKAGRCTDPMALGEIYDLTCPAAPGWQLVRRAVKTALGDAPEMAIDSGTESEMRQAASRLDPRFYYVRPV